MSDWRVNDLERCVKRLEANDDGGCLVFALAAVVYVALGFAFPEHVWTDPIRFLARVIVALGTGAR